MCDGQPFVQQHFQVRGGVAQRVVVFHERLVGHCNQIHRPTPPGRRYVGRRAVVVVGVESVMLAIVHGAEIDRRSALRPERFNVHHAQGIGPKRLEVIWIDEQQQPAVTGAEPTPQLRRQVGARDLGDEMQGTFASLLILGRDRPRPRHVLGHHGQAAKPGAGRFCAGRYLPPQDCGDVFGYGQTVGWRVTGRCHACNHSD